MNTIDDIIERTDKMWVDGHILATQDVKQAESSFLVNMSRQEMPDLLREIKIETVKSYTEYIIKFIKKQNKIMIDTIVEEQ